MKMIPSSEIVYIFDLDDTLVKTDARVKVFCSSSKKLLHSLTPADYNYYTRKENQILNFDDFDDLNILLSGTLIDKNIRILKKAAKNHQIGIVTARAHLGSVIQFFQKVQLPVSRDLVFAVNDPTQGFTGTIPEKKRQAFQRMIFTGIFSFVYYDDNLENLESVKTLETENIKIETIHA